MKTLTVVIFCLLLFPWTVQSAEYYRWVDENGVSHVSDQPPPQTGKNVKTYRFKKPPEPVVPQTQAGGEASGIAGESPSEGGQPMEDQQGQDRNQELEKARQEYEEAKSHETEYRRNFNDSYGYGKDRNYWRGKLDDIENKRQKLENLESGGVSSDGASSGGVSSPGPAGDDTQR
jgi:hypothetical protein